MTVFKGIVQHFGKLRVMFRWSGQASPVIETTRVLRRSWWRITAAFHGRWWLFLHSPRHTALFIWGKNQVSTALSEVSLCHSAQWFPPESCPPQIEGFAKKNKTGTAMALMASLPKMLKCPFKLCHYERHTLRYNASAPFSTKKITSFFKIKMASRKHGKKANLPTKIWTIPSKSQHIHIWGYNCHVLLRVVVKLIARAVSEQLFLNFLWSVATVHRDLNWLFSRSPANLKKKKVSWLGWPFPNQKRFHITKG